MNKVILVGRLTKDPEVKNTSSQVPFCNFTVAVDRRFKDANGQRQADFISCVAWRQTASFIGSYFRKGSKIGLTGSIQTRTYDDNNGQKRYVTEVVVEEAEFVESANNSGAPRTQGNGNGAVPPPPPPQGSMAAAAPAAPKSTIAPSMDDDSFDDGGDLGLPFEF
ncbi:MAG: single-stranded DNA-binding protein [Saccharofermentans sp.]|nr:single-stranded DNA-binding protein [Saccharofermentans sp.]